MGVARSTVKSPLIETFKRSDIKISKEKNTSLLSEKIIEKIRSNEIQSPAPARHDKNLLIYGDNYWSPTVDTIATTMLLAGLVMPISAIFYNINLWMIWLILLVPTGILLFKITDKTKHNRFVIFDKENQVVHIPKLLSKRQDTINWGDTSFLIHDHHNPVKPTKYEETHLSIIRPPDDLIVNGAPSAYLRYKLINVSDCLENKYTDEDAEEIYCYILRFMEKKSPTLREEAHTKNKNPPKNIDSEDWQWSLLKTEKLPKKPNWIRHPDGRWERTGPGTVIRKTLLDGFRKSKGHG
ncbi:hypothetical protein [Ectothiorhodospira lacustris]|uniref:hypothetical protein n=1 Tax=Ectothiorhodospira lacustris TaxID=2899127 RepID=UPI001EE8A108|nr:hypothetical protein [Ectothiorhodospira lacustris]MCG5500198.1 hypothetical protein [Ectothiorhodospira lacustris]